MQSKSKFWIYQALILKIQYAEIRSTNTFLRQRGIIKFLNIKDIKSSDNFINGVNGLPDKEDMYLCLN